MKSINVLMSYSKWRVEWIKLGNKLFAYMKGEQKSLFGYSTSKETQVSARYLFS